MGRESQATTIVGVESSDCHPASRVDALGCSSPEVRVERIGSQVVANTMGRVAMLGADVDNDLPTTVPAFSGLNGNTESTTPIPALVDVPFVCHSTLDPNRSVVQESTEVDVSGTVIDGHESVAEVFPMRGVQVEVASNPEGRSMNRFAVLADDVVESVVEFYLTREDSEEHR